MKVGKEEIMGMVTAVEMWVNHRDHAAEAKEFERKMNLHQGPDHRHSRGDRRSEPTRTAAPMWRATLSISWERKR